MSRNHLIKIDLDGHLRMMEILEPRFDALVEAISEAYRISETAGLTFMYVDVDNDKITFNTDRELEVALRTSRVPLRVFVKKGRPDEQALPTPAAATTSRVMQPTVAVQSDAGAHDIPSTHGYAIAPNVSSVTGDEEDDPDLIIVGLPGGSDAVPGPAQPTGSEEERDNINMRVAFEIEEAAARDPEGSILYQKASRRLAKRHRVHLTPTQLWRVMALFQLQGRQLVIWGLAPKSALDASLASSTPMSSSDAEDEGKEEMKNGDTACTNRRPGAVRRGRSCVARGHVASPVRTVLELNGVEIPEEEVAPLLEALRVRPRRLVKLGLLNSDALSGLPEEESRRGISGRFGHPYGGSCGFGGDEICRGRVAPFVGGPPPDFQTPPGYMYGWEPHIMYMPHVPGGVSDRHPHYESRGRHVQHPHGRPGGPPHGPHHGHPRGPPHGPPPRGDEYQGGGPPHGHPRGPPRGPPSHGGEHPAGGPLHAPPHGHPRGPPHGPHHGHPHSPPYGPPHGPHHDHPHFPPPSGEHASGHPEGPPHGARRAYTNCFYGMGGPPWGYMLEANSYDSVARAGGPGRGGKESMAMVRFVEHRSPAIGSDVAHVAPGQSFKKSWLVRNDSSTTWPEDVSLVPVSRSCQDLSSPPETPAVGGVAPGEETEVSVDLVAPTLSGMYEGFWRTAGGGRRFGQRLWAKVMVVSPQAEDAVSNMDAGVEKLSLDDGNKEK